MTLELIVPVRNCPAKIFRLLNTMDAPLTRLSENLKMTIVDDASTDDTLAVVQAWAKGRANVSIIALDHNRCIGGARNAAIEKSAADYIIFSDADDDIKTEILDKLLEAMASSPDMIIYGFESIYDRQTVKWLPKFDDNYHWVGTPVTACCKCIKREKLVRFQENVFCEDCDWWFRQADNISNYKLIQEVGYIYDNRGQSFSSAIIWLKDHPRTIEQLAYENTLNQQHLNDRCPSDVLRTLAALYDLRNVVKKPIVKQYLMARFSSIVQNVMTGRWSY